MSFIIRPLLQRRRPSHEYQPLIVRHVENHFESPEIVRDIVIGLSDGLTVPFALAAGLSSLGDSRLVVIGGLAELISGAISMGLGGFLAAKSEADHYATERVREENEVRDCVEEEIDEVVEILEPYGLDRASLTPLIDKLVANPEKFVDFMMKFELNLEKPDPHRSWVSALTIGLSYFFGGFIPLIPYMLVDSAMTGLYISVAVTFFALLFFGFIKSFFMSPKNTISGAVNTAMVGMLAAAAAFGLVKVIEKF
ncbi:11049_t:CDS:2 [Ambispora leptoticha]|uniref:11049_t:CDS:1 n=1 Tax=Ambispora leptoticha TaxID=144679 RepID=A0A9N9AV11_9GLOM|nr:11049_t:CDS:2 [Ambispora leptoticha]